MVVTLSDGLKPRTFCQEDRGTMYVLDGGLYAREFVHTVYCFFWRRAVLHENGEMLEHDGGAWDLIH